MALRSSKPSNTFQEIKFNMEKNGGCVGGDDDAIKGRCPVCRSSSDSAIYRNVVTQSVYASVGGNLKSRLNPSAGVNAPSYANLSIGMITLGRSLYERPGERSSATFFCLCLGRRAGGALIYLSIDRSRKQPESEKPLR